MPREPKWTNETTRRVAQVLLKLCQPSPKPVDEEPIATIFSGSPDFKRASAWGNRAPSDRFAFAARQVSAVDVSVAN